MRWIHYRLLAQGKNSPEGGENLNTAPGKVEKDRLKTP